MSPEQRNLLHNLPMNGGRLSLAMYRREEFAEMEANGWLAYRHGDLCPYMEITPEGSRAVADELYGSRACPVCDGVGRHEWNCSLNAA